jgi:DNA adenine methylase
MRYYGGKWRLAPWVISHFPPHRVYVEPFGGAGSVLMQKPRSKGEIYNDLADEVVNVFRVLRDTEKAAELHEMLRLTPYARAELELAFECGDRDVEQARRTIVRSFLGFSGSGTAGTKHTRKGMSRRTGFRSIATRGDTFPAQDWATYADCIPAFVKRLRGVVIEQWPAIDLVRRFDAAHTLFYVDPPYLAETRVSHETYHFELTGDQHKELAELLRSAKGMAVVSGYRTELYDALYAGWTRVDLDARTLQNAVRVESLWLSPTTSAALHPKLIA